MATNATGTTLSTTAAVSLAQAAGFSGNGLATIVAIAYAESGLRSNAIGGPNYNGTYDYGILQINTVHMGQSWPGGVMSVNQALDPAIAFKFGYWLSGGGKSFSAWSTFNSGKYTTYLGIVDQTIQTSNSNALVTNNGQQPWWDFPRIDNFGQIDPQGAYYKPDSNILTPSGYPIISPVSGVVTSVQRTDYGQTVETILLNTPINPLATHVFFEHMHDATVGVGSVVTPGTLLGHANYTGEGANLGFGFYSGDIYGSGLAWSQLQHDLAPGGAGLLNPVNYLNALKANDPTMATIGMNGAVLDPFGLQGLLSSIQGGGQGWDTGNTTWDNLAVKVHNTLVQYPGFYGIAAALDEAEQFQGIFVSNQNPYIGGNLNPANDVYDWSESVIGTVVGNTLPAVIRGTMIGIGVFIILAFIWQMMKPVMEFLPEIALGAAALA